MFKFAVQRCTENVLIIGNYWNHSNCVTKLNSRTVGTKCRITQFLHYVTFWLCDLLTMLTIGDFYIFYFFILLPAKLSRFCLFIPSLPLFYFRLIFASSLKHYYCPLLFVIESCHDVWLHVAPTLPAAFLRKKKSRLYS